MKRGLLSLFAMAVLPIALPFAAPDNSIGPPSACSEGYRSNSYGVGLEAGYRSIDLRPESPDTWWDEWCYQAGRQRGRTVASENLSNCNAEFDAGKALGIRFGMNTSTHDCSLLGYQAGVAHLDMGARAGDTALVGEKCVAHYNRGLEDGKSLAASQPGTTQQPEAHCYDAGYLDGYYYSSK